MLLMFNLILYLPAVEIGSNFADIGEIGQKVYSHCLLVIMALSRLRVTLRPGFQPRPFQVEFVVGRRELELISLRVL